MRKYKTKTEFLKHFTKNKIMMNLPGLNTVNIYLTCQKMNINRKTFYTIINFFKINNQELK